MRLWFGEVVPSALAAIECGAIGNALQSTTVDVGEPSSSRRWWIGESLSWLYERPRGGRLERPSAFCHPVDDPRPVNRGGTLGLGVHDSGPARPVASSALSAGGQQKSG